MNYEGEKYIHPINLAKFIEGNLTPIEIETSILFIFP